VKDPARFNGRFIEVRAKVISSMEFGGLQDDTCSAWVHLSYTSDTYLADHQGDEYAFVPVVRDPKNQNSLRWNPALPKPAKWDSDHPPPDLKWKRVQTPRPVVRKEDEEDRKLSKYVAEKFIRSNGERCWSCPLYKVTATITGRFDHSNTPLVAIRSKKLVDYKSAGFGHLGAALSQLVVESVSDVVAEPIDPSLYEKNK
jgi:hypothetical protein